MRRLVVLTNWGCEDFIKDLYDRILDKVTYDPDDVTKDDTLLLEGGTDIGPSFYGESIGKFTQTPDVLRDKVEWKQLLKFKEKGATILGICRGAQLVTAFLGGKIIQHVTGHSRSHGHPIVTKEKINLWTSSLHHQMMHPYNLHTQEYKIIATTPHNISKYFLNGMNQEVDNRFIKVFGEPEIVWYPKIKALAIQGHPEFMPYESKFVQYCRNLVKEKLLNVK